MICAGVDIGTRTAKAMVTGENGALGWEIEPVNDTVDRVSKRILQSAAERAGVRRRKLSCIAATGYGRKSVRAADVDFPVPLCVARAVYHLHPEARLALDIGGLITRFIRIGDKGTVADYLENERCASGSGRFLETIAEALEVSLEQIGPLSLTSQRPLPLTGQCVVFAESEVVNHVNAGEQPADILAGVHRSIAERVYALAMRVGLQPPVAVCGGVARNSGVVHFLRQILGVPLLVPDCDPQLVGALGAALLAREKRRR
jgi:predicted CoA-substrate-specific enzyme activase